MNKKGFFITGTDTSVGKTFFSYLLMKRNIFYYWKPIQTGKLIEDDSLFLKKKLNLSNNRILKPIYRFNRPLSPHLAAKDEKVIIKMSNIKIPNIEGNIIVEGAGGILVPLNNSDLMIDLIKKLKFPVIIVSKSVLGTINHTLMTLEILRKKKINILGVVLNKIKNKKEGKDHVKSIEKFGRVKVLAEIPFFKKINNKEIDSFSKNKLFNVFKK
tara:strand:- start:6333 stop:6974 length:642 start_codon:yes stop_codon:yes gene_type:complete